MSYQSIDQTTAIAKSKFPPPDVVRLNPNFEAVTETNQLRARAYLGETIEHSIRINNRSGSTLDLFWVDQGGRKVNLVTLPDYTDQNLGSIVNNEFEVQELDTGHGPCESSPTGCRTTRFKNHGGHERKYNIKIATSLLHHYSYYPLKVLLFLIRALYCNSSDYNQY